MTGTRLGPYRLGEELGSGGMGSVYSADVVEDVAGIGDAKKVAIKVIHPHLLEKPGFFKRFMREADIGKSVKHEAVVKTFDVDALMVDGKMVNFMVMEFVEGRTLRDLLDDLKQVPETLLREIARQVTGGLQAIHDAGIVHRDLKPENVLITPDDEVKVMDLGVARLVEETVALTRDGQFTGSVLYAAPEQFEAAGVGPRSDLYSIGVMLYELAAGTNPFQRDDAVACMKAHLTDVPPRLSDRATDVSMFLSELVGNLLDKDPANRPGSATALHTLFVEGENSTWWGDREQEILKEEGHLPKIPVRRETKLLGRDDDLEVLRDAWKSATAGEGRMVLLEGEAGIGKSRLVDTLLQDMKGQDVHVLYGSYPPSGGLGGLSESLTDKFGSRGMEEALAPYLTVTPRLIPAFAAMVRHESVPEGAEPLTADSFQTVFVHLMKALAEEKPLLWIVDDLHFAAEDSRKIVMAMARALPEQRVLIVATARPGLPEDDVAHFSRLAAFKEISLERLGARQIVELLQQALGSSALAEKLGGTIGYKSDGVPFFVFEIIRGLKEGNFITQRPDGTWAETQAISAIEVPSSVKDLIEARLRGISDDDRDMLDVAAVQGVEFDPDLIAQVCEMRTVKVLRRLAAMERDSGVVRGTGERCRFDHNQIQETLYETLMPRLRKENHALLADAYAEREDIADTEPGDIPGEAQEFLASHHLKGSRPKNALPHLLPALESLAASYRNEAVLDLGGRALDARGLLGGAERFEALERMARRFGLLGRKEEWQEALEEMTRVAAELKEAGLRARAAQEMGLFHHLGGRPEEARRQCEEALALLVEAGDRKREAGVLNTLGLVAWRNGANEEAEGHYRQAVALYRELGDRRGEGLALGNLGGLLHESGRGAEGHALIEEALAIARETGDRAHESMRTVDLGEGCRQRGEAGRALEHYQAARTLAREIGDRESDAYASMNQVETLLLLGDRVGAAPVLEASTCIAAEMGRAFLVAWTSLLHGETARGDGDAAEAERQYGEALERAREGGIRILQAATLARWGGSLAAGGRGSEAAAHLAEAAEIARETGEPNFLALSTALLATLPDGDPAAAAKTLDDLGEEPWIQYRMESRWYLWQATQDAAHLTEAKRLLDHLVEHAPEEYKTSMIENVPLHKSIREASA